ncbi:alpha/beta fold hydrolase [Flavobacterium defluvii]|uniref:Pimeloyl-ACP methyl ester carboxylesterase n=1 Tax=Flavobacterium defluvii TaxID=370979 RepID=A0A1M5W3T6_9FLAO|nr:alpha/beta hydrolase [Flavobacterium defluvii]SHH81854.1 Pimeloyl-ACP methyl ester carboxylesterase [Flavobacterium defluvii]
MYLSNTKTIVFISGAFVSHFYWGEWLTFFENKGYKVVAPPWLHKNDSVENLRKHNACLKIGTISLFDLLCYYTEIIEKLPEKPILVGHSYGGLLVQLLVQKDLAEAAICINSFPPKGFTNIKFSFYAFIIRFSSGIFSSGKTFFLSFENWKNTFFNFLSIEEQKNEYEKFTIPESKKALRNLFSKNAKINFRKKHVPLFFISGSEDQIISPKLVKWNYRKHRNIHSITCYKEFKNKNHFVILNPEWKEVAECAAKWIEKVT